MTDCPQAFCKFRHLRNKNKYILCESASHWFQNLFLQAKKHICTLFLCLVTFYTAWFHQAYNTNLLYNIADHRHQGLVDADLPDNLLLLFSHHVHSPVCRMQYQHFRYLWKNQKVLHLVYLNKPYLLYL